MWLVTKKSIVNSFFRIHFTLHCHVIDHMHTLNQITFTCYQLVVMIQEMGCYFFLLPLQLDAKTYYEEKHDSLSTAIDQEKEVVKERKRLGIGFITFNMEIDAKR